jgi:hypothetical protein
MLADGSGKLLDETGTIIADNGQNKGNGHRGLHAR